MENSFNKIANHLFFVIFKSEGFAHWFSRESEEGHELWVFSDLVKHSKRNCGNLRFICCRSLSVKTRVLITTKVFQKQWP